MKGIARISAAILAGTLLVSGMFTSIQTLPAQAGTVIAQATPQIVVTERQRLLGIYNRQGLQPLIVELRKPSTNRAILAERQRLLVIYNRQGRTALIAELRRPAVVVAPTPTPTMVPTPEPTMTPMVEPTPYMAPTPVPTPRVTPTPVPMITSAPSPRPTPRVGIAAPTPTPAPVVVITAPTPAPFIGIKADYWGASDETAANALTTMNSPFIGANLELLMLDPLFIGASYHSMLNMQTSNFWDAYARAMGIKLGYRREDLQSPGIPAGLHADNLLAGLMFGVPILGETLMFDFDINAGYTLNGLPVVAGTTAANRWLLDGTAALKFQPLTWMNVFVGYRSYVFGTQDDMTNLATMSNTRSAFFGSYQGPLAGAGFRF